MEIKIEYKDHIFLGLNLEQTAFRQMLTPNKISIFAV
jgi:hypothetical protein